MGKGPVGTVTDQIGIRSKRPRWEWVPFKWTPTEQGSVQKDHDWAGFRSNGLGLALFKLRFADAFEARKNGLDKRSCFRTFKK